MLVEDMDEAPYELTEPRLRESSSMHEDVYSKNGV
jgi:hypothetical protein